MKILMLAWNFPPAQGGIEYVAKHLAAGLRAAGDSVRIIARHDPAGELEPDVARPLRPGLLRYLWFAWRKSSAWLRVDSADLIVCPGIVTVPVAWLIGKRRGVPYAVLAHGTDVTHGGWIYRQVARFFFGHALGVACNSRSTAELVERGRFSAAPRQIIHPGVKLEDYPTPAPEIRFAARRELKFDGRFVLLALGRLIRRKGILEFVERAMPDLVRQLPDVLLVVAGGDAADSLVHHEGMAGLIRRTVVRLGLDNHVRLLGSVSDAEVRKLHLAADVHVLPALRLENDVEGFGIVLLESALAETPVLATRVGGIPEAVAEHVSGLLVEPGDWAGMAAAILRLRSDDELRKQLGRQGRERVCAHFGWKTIADQYRDFFGDLAGGARPAP